MANLKSSKKDIRRIKVRTSRNAKVKNEMKKAVKTVRKLADTGKTKEAEEKFVLATKKIDKAAKTNVIRKNAASRYKSRLSKWVNRAKKASK